MPSPRPRERRNKGWKPTSVGSIATFLLIVPLIARPIACLPHCLPIAPPAMTPWLAPPSTMTSACRPQRLWGAHHPVMATSYTPDRSMSTETCACASDWHPGRGASRLPRAPPPARAPRAARLPDGSQPVSWCSRPRRCVRRYWPSSACRPPAWRPARRRSYTSQDRR